MKKNKIDYIIMVTFIIFMPLHSMLFNLIIPTKIDNAWRDVLLLLGMFLIILRKKGYVNIGKYGPIIILVSILILIYTFLSDRLSMTLNLTRTYVMPMFIYFYIINISLSQNEIDSLKRIIVSEGVILAIWGIFQAFVLGDDFLIKLGYPSVNGYLKSTGFYINGFHGMQRVTSTFVYPNVCGLYFGLIILLLSTMTGQNKKYRYYMVIMIIALITTFSRSALLGTLLGLFLLYRNKIFRFRFRTSYLFIFFFAVVSVVLVDQYYLSGRVMNMINKSILSTINMSDLSALQHKEDLIKPLSTLLDRPLGLGYGYNGPTVLATFGEANTVESSFFLLAYDFGIVGAIIYLLPMTLEILSFNSESRFKKLSGATSLLILFTSFLLPNLQNYEVVFYVYFFIAFYNMEYNIYKINNYERIV